MAFYLHDRRRFHYARAPKSGIVTRAYLDDPGKAGAEAAAIDEEFVRMGCPEGKWFPSETTCAVPVPDERIDGDCQVLAIPLIDPATEERLGEAFAAIDREGTLTSPCQGVDDAISLVGTGGPKM